MALFTASERSAIRRELDLLYGKHVELNKASRDVVKKSKELIYATNRGDLSEAKKKLAEIKTERDKLDRIANTPKLRNFFPYQLAVQEYVEAVAFYSIISTGKIPTRKELSAETEAYLMGLSDLTGELVRKAVDDMINERYKHAISLKGAVEEVYGLILGLNLEGGDTRRKSDQVKWNLSKLEDLIYDAKIRDKI